MQIAVHTVAVMVPDTTTTHRGPEGPWFATVAETAKVLRLSKSQVYTLITEGVIPAKRYGDAIRISWAWIESEVEAPR